MTPEQPQFSRDVEARIERHLQEVDGSLARSGVPLRERQNVLADLRAQIFDLLSGAPGEATVGQVEAVLAGMDSPESYGVAAKDEECPAAANPPPVSNQPLVNRLPTERAGAWSVAILTLGGIVLPLVTLFYELFTGFSASNFFDPMPSWWHVGLVAFVPLINLLMLVAILTRSTVGRGFLGLGSGVAITISLVYAAIYGPPIPFAIMAVIFMGIGLLPLSPLIALLCTLYARRKYRLVVTPLESRPLGGLWGGMLLGAVAILAVSLPALSVEYGLRLASSEDVATREHGIAWLRSRGSQRELLRACYASPMWFRRGFAVDPRWNRDEVRKIYYRVTGRAFDTEMPPMGILSSLGDERSAMLQLDPDVRDETVGWREHRLVLSGSRLDGVADADSGFGYLEWTMTFVNHASWQREAVCEVGLPPGGVVSRLTLWVNGEEREAAFAGRGDVTQAYEKVVARRQDPVLVNTSGADRVLVRCFPVPSDGGQMKIRLGITYPLVQKSGGEVLATLPRLLDRNYSIPADLRHAVWIDCMGKPGRTNADSLGMQHADGVTRAVGRLKDDELCSSPLVLLTRSAAGETSSPDLAAPDKFKIMQSVEEVRDPAPSQMILVLDSSVQMKEHIGEIARAVELLPREAKIRLVVARDEEGAPAKPQVKRPDEAAMEIRGLAPVGGHDAVPALERACMDAAETSGAVIVWVHAPQAVQLGSADGLTQMIDRITTRPVIHELQVAPGKDVVVKQLAQSLEFRTVARLGSVGEDLRRVLGTLYEGNPRLEFRRERLPLAAGETVTSPTRFSGHVARLWAHESIRSMMRRKPREAVALAAQYQLVTPVTGAVVLETQQQYRDAGLQPVDVSSVPTIPEPHEWALIAAGLAVLAVVTMVARRRQRLA